MERASAARSAVACKGPTNEEEGIGDDAATVEWTRKAGDVPGKATAVGERGDARSIAGSCPGRPDTVGWAAVAIEAGREGGGGGRPASGEYRSAGAAGGTGTSTTPKCAAATVTVVDVLIVVVVVCRVACVRAAGA